MLMNIVGYFSKIKTILNSTLFSTVLTYPKLADGVEVESGADAWVLGSFVEIIPVDTITTSFQIFAIKCRLASATDDYIIDLYKGTSGNEVLICSVPFSSSSGANTVNSEKVVTMKLDANERISAKIANSGSTSATLEVKLKYSIA